MACDHAAFPRVDGAMTLKVTPGGTESGAEPILDWHGDVVAKVLEGLHVRNAGNKNVGIDSVD